jgi:hypothetical protein
MAFAPGTKRNLMTQLKAYISFCTYFSLVSFPIHVDTLTIYIECLANTFKAPTSVLNYISGVKTLHSMLGFKFPQLDSFLFKVQIRGITKKLQHRPKQAQPISPSMFISIKSLLDFNSSFQNSIWALFTISFFTFARLSNMVPLTSKQYDINKHLSRSDITITLDSLIVRFKWSKTIQDGSRVVLIPLVAMPHNPLCPYTAYCKLVSLVPAPAEFSAFTYIKGSNLYNLVTSDVVSTLRILLTSLGFDASLYSGHSFRRSGATWAFSAGVNPLSIKSHGDWKSLSYLQYIQISDQQKRMVSQQMLSSISGL